MLAGRPGAGLQGTLQPVVAATRAGDANADAGADTPTLALRLRLRLHPPPEDCTGPVVHRQSIRPFVHSPILCVEIDASRQPPAANRQPPTRAALGEGTTIPRQKVLGRRVSPRLPPALEPPLPPTIAASCQTPR